MGTPKRTGIGEDISRDQVATQPKQQIQPQKTFSPQPQFSTPPIQVPQGLSAYGQELAELFDKYIFPKLLGEIYPQLVDLLGTGLFFVKSPAFVEPTLLSRPIEGFTPIVAGVPPILPAAMPNFQNLFTITIPERTIGVLTTIGHFVQNDPNGFNWIEWQIKINGAPFSPYNSWMGQLGTFESPTKFAIPLLLQPNSRVELNARNTDPANPYNVVARIQGYVLPVDSLSYDLRKSLSVF